MEMYFTEHSCHEGHQEENNFNVEEYLRELTERFIESSTNATPPASKQAIKNLEVVWIDEEHILDDASCPICIEAFEISTKALVLPCNHLFHEKCLIEWLQKRATCPLCRTEIETDDPEYEEKKLDKKNPERKKENISFMYM
eukprot:gene9577-1780_t